MKLVRNHKGPQPLIVPRLGLTAKDGDVVEISEEQREIGQELIDQGYFAEQAPEKAAPPTPIRKDKTETSDPQV